MSQIDFSLFGSIVTGVRDCPVSPTQSGRGISAPAAAFPSSALYRLLGTALGKLIALGLTGSLDLLRSAMRIRFSLYSSGRPL